jgi:hypothetical protein
MKYLSKLVAVAAIILTFMSTSAQADPGITTHMRADVTFGEGEASCSFFDAPLSADPPSHLIIYLSLAPYRTCSSSGTVTLNDDPSVSFDDPSAAATVDRARSTVVRFGVSCGYEATNVWLPGDVSVRDYSGSFAATRVSGSIFVCPSTTTGSMTVDFH